MDKRHNPCGPGWTRRFITFFNVQCQSCSKRLEVVEIYGWHIECPSCKARYQLKVEPFCYKEGIKNQPILLEDTDATLG